MVRANVPSTNPKTQIDARSSLIVGPRAFNGGDAS
jgi:hypothetical protein